MGQEPRVRHGHPTEAAFELSPEGGIEFQPMEVKGNGDPGRTAGVHGAPTMSQALG